MPNEFIVQIALLVLAAALFAAAFFVGRRHMRRAAGDPAERPVPLTSADAPSMGPIARTLFLTGAALSLALLTWRIIDFGPLAPLTNHYDAFLLLALLLTGMVLYLRWTKNLRGLAFFLLPMIAMLLLVGGGLSIAQNFTNEKTYDYHNIWTLLHILSIVVGSVCFAAGCVGGIVYLIAARQLKRKPSSEPARGRWTGLPPLASIERINRIFVYIGFPALTLVMITGILRIAQEHEGFRGLTLASPKIILAFLAWIVYALLLQVPLSPAFRGRRAAWLSIFGFALFLGGYVAVVWMK